MSYAPWCQIPNANGTSHQYFTCNDGSSLEGLAQAHIIGQHPMQAAPLQEGQPAYAGLLILPQLTPHLEREREIVHLTASNEQTHMISNHQRLQGVNLNVCENT
jgi:hypothetical protein